MGPACNEYAPWTSHGINMSILITRHLIMAWKYYLSLIRRYICSTFARKSRLLITNKRMLKSALYQFINVTRRFNRRIDNASEPIKIIIKVHKTQVIWVSIQDIQQGEIIGIQGFVRAERGTPPAPAQRCGHTAPTLSGLSMVDKMTLGNQYRNESDCHLGSQHSRLL